MARLGRRRDRPPVAEIVEDALVASGGPPVRTHRRMEGFTAAATFIDLADEEAAKREAARQRKRPMAWQRDAWRYHDELSEVRTYGRFMGDTQSRVRLYPAILSDDPRQPPSPAIGNKEVDQGDATFAVQVLEQLSSVDGDRQELQRVFGLNLAVAGEVWAVGTESDDEISETNPSGEAWRACSVDEVTATREGKWAIRPYPDCRESELEVLDPDTSVLIRIYRRHGRWRTWPDSPMRSANLICEELLLATEDIMGVLRSRIPAGILPIPDDLEDDDEDLDDAERAKGVDPTLRKLMKHLEAARRDPRSASSRVPYLLKVPMDVIDKIKLVDLYKSIDPEEGARIELLIRRLAIAVDMPPEALLGTGDMNHWSAWLVGDEGVRNYVEPYTTLYTDPLTIHYYRPRLLAAGVPDVDRWTIAADPSECVAHPDQKENAQEGWDRILLSDATLVSAYGYGEEDMPDDAERARRIEEQKALKPQPFGGPVPAVSVDGDNVKKGTPPAPSDVEAGIRAATPAVLAAAREAVAAAQRTGPTMGQQWARIESVLFRDLLVAADGALARMVERAQARIKSAAQKAPATRALAGATPVEQLPTVLGHDRVRGELGVDDDDLTKGGLAALALLFAKRTAAAQQRALDVMRAEGIEIDPEVEDDYNRRADAARDEGFAALDAALAATALALLFPGGQPTIPTQGEIDSALAASPADIRSALSAAGGGVYGGGAAVGGPVLPSDGLVGLLSGKDFTTLLEATPGFERNGWTWEVGAPDRPFEPHQDLNGEHFTSWTDPVLAASPDDFPYVSFYAPDDHPGCQCTAVPEGTATLAADDPSPEA